MLNLPLKKLYFLVKLCFLFVLVLITLSLFEYWRGGKRATRAVLVEPDEEMLERQILEDEARIVPGLGEGGRPAYLTGEDKRLGDESEKKYAINTYLSDRIAYNRTLKDFRNPACDRVIYDAELPSTSVIIIFHNEPYSVVVRTIWSVLNTARRDQPWHRRANYLERGTGRVMKLGYPGQPEDSEHVYLKEIILVDDNSTLPELRGKLARYIRTRLPPDMVRVLRLPDRIGLTRARLAGARYASGDVLIFLDAHCEGVVDWMRPMLQRIKDSPTAVVMPIIDVIEHKDFLYSVQDPAMFQVGGFTFVGHFTWIDVPERELKRRGSDISPTWSPTMAGGLFAIRRSYYWDLGAYDEQMAGWGGENLEMSFRIWQCGGTLETIPCSRVGHVFRAFHPYGLPANSDTHGINTARMAEVWMDDYAELFYLHRPDLRKNPKIGDVTHRKILREKLHCKSFQWYLDNVYQEKYVPVRDSQAYGRVKNAATKLCLDTMQREGDATPLGFYPCHAQLTDTQFLSLSLAGQLRTEERCADVQFVRSSHLSAEDEGAARAVVVTACRDKHPDRVQWRRLAGTGQLQHADSGLCLDARGARAGDDARVRPCVVSAHQRWSFDYDGQNATPGVLPAELEEKLKKIKGQRRMSRSLLSVSEEEGAARAGRGSAEGAGPEPARRRRGNKRRRRSKRKQKKIHKNKFIVTVERTLPNNSVEHLEMDIYCKHRKLYPNNSFVRDLVSILNDRDIRVINNGRVFEKNKVTELKDHLRHAEEMANTPPYLTYETTGALTEKQWSDASPAPRPSPHTETDASSTTEPTEYSKSKKHRHKKRLNKKERSRSQPLADYADYNILIGGGSNGTKVKLRADPEPAADSDAQDQELRPHWPPALTPRPASAERPADLRPRPGDGHRAPVEPREPTEPRIRAREEAIARHAAVLELQQAAAGRPRGEDGQAKAQIPSDAETGAEREHHTAEHDRRAADRGRHVPEQGRPAAEHERHILEHDRRAADRGRHVPEQDRSAAEHERHVTEHDRRAADRGRHVPEQDRSAADYERYVTEHDGRAADRERHTVESDAELNLWDPWSSRAADNRHIADLTVGDSRKKFPKDPHDEVDKLVFDDVWARAPQADSRVSELARQVMLQYDDTSPQPREQPRGELREHRAHTEHAALRGSGGGGAGGAGGRRRPLRVRVRSNMTFNLGDDLLNWRRMRMSEPESESESVSDDDYS